MKTVYVEEIRKFDTDKMPTLRQTLFRIRHSVNNKNNSLCIRRDYIAGNGFIEVQFETTEKFDAA